MRSFRASARVLAFGLVLCAGAMTAGAESAPTTVFEQQLWNEFVKQDSNAVVSSLGAEIALEVLAASVLAVCARECGQTTLFAAYVADATDR